MAVSSDKLNVLGSNAVLRSHLLDVSMQLGGIVAAAHKEHDDTIRRVCAEQIGVDDLKPCAAYLHVISLVHRFFLCLHHTYIVPESKKKAIGKTLIESMTYVRLLESLRWREVSGGGGRRGRP